jgi:hypothetical protein
VRPTARSASWRIARRPSRRGKTLAWDKEAGRLKRLPTADFEFVRAGRGLAASYRVASLAAEGMAALAPWRMASAEASR